MVRGRVGGGVGGGVGGEVRVGGGGKCGGWVRQGLGLRTGMGVGVCYLTYLRGCVDVSRVSLCLGGHDKFSIANTGVFFPVPLCLPVSEATDAHLAPVSLYERSIELGYVMLYL